MTLVYQTAPPADPGTHVLAIGVGAYPHLLGAGPQQLANNPLGLRQLQSPPVSLRALLNQFLAFVGGAPDSIELSAPLASIEALASSPTTFIVNTPKTGAIVIDAAIKQNIEDAFGAWLNRMKSHPDNIGVFYFCGHGIMASDHYLLAQDFGHNNNQPWDRAFNISRTIRAVEREVPGTVYYFIDACRDIVSDIAKTPGSEPSPLLAMNLGNAMIRKSTSVIYATGEGQSAFAPRGDEVSYFTSALLCAMSGYCGTKNPGVATWNVDGENLASAIRQLLEYDVLPSRNARTSKQVSEQSIQGSSVPILRLTTAPLVKVWLDLKPSQRRAMYELYLQSINGDRYTQALLDQVFRTEVRRGFYNVGAHDPNGNYPPVVHPNEDLTPPMYTLTLQSSP